jgi:hypothetical protein
MDCQIDEFILDYPGENTDSKSFNDQDYKLLSDSDIYINRLEIKDNLYYLFCGGNQDKSNVISANIKLKFNSPDFRILSHCNKELDFDSYMDLNRNWWKYVSDN